MARIHRIDNVIHAEVLDGVPPFVKKRRNARGRMGVGLRYERSVQRHLGDIFGFEYVPGPWIQYRVADRPKVVNYAQPDGLLIQTRQGIVTIVEIKYSHCPESYFQLVDKYLPLARELFSDDWTFHLCTVVKWYDRDTSYPADIKMCKEIDHCTPHAIGVHICRPGK